MKTLYNKEYDRLEIYFDKNKKVDSEYWQGIWEEDLVLSKLNYKKIHMSQKLQKNIYLLTQRFLRLDVD